MQVYRSIGTEIFDTGFCQDYFPHACMQCVLSHTSLYMTMIIISMQYQYYCDAIMCL